MSTISVIIPNYNHGRYLKQRINSVLNQTFQDYELIILDDASTDNSRDIIEAYRDNPHISHIVYNEKNGGTPFKQWDKGIELASGEWIWIAESDDFADERFLEVLWGKVKANPSVGFAYTATYFVNEMGDIIGQSRTNEHCQPNYCVHESQRFIKERLLIRNTIDNVSECIFKKELYHPEKRHLYEDMKLCGDWFFYVLLLEQTKVLEVYDLLSSYRKHSSNTVISTEHLGKTFTEGIDIYKYISQNIMNYTIQDKQKIARYWLVNKDLYHYSDNTNREIRNLYFKELPSVVTYYYILSFGHSIKHFFKGR